MTILPLHQELSLPASQNPLSLQLYSHLSQHLSISLLTIPHLSCSLLQCLLNSITLMKQGMWKNRARHLKAKAGNMHDDNSRVRNHKQQQAFAKDQWLGKQELRNWRYWTTIILSHHPWCSRRLFAGLQCKEPWINLYVWIGIRLRTAFKR